MVNFSITWVAKNGSKRFLTRDKRTTSASPPWYPSTDRHET